MKRALFLDRDGVINIEKNYLHRREDFEFIDGIFELCHHYQSQGYEIFVVTNQSGIVRAYYTQEQFLELSAWMKEEFAKQGISIKEVYYCPHHPEFSGECACRKPNPGMLLQAKKDFGIDLQHSILVGDKESDIEAALNAGLEESYLFDASGTSKSSKATKIVSKLNDIWKNRC